MTTSHQLCDYYAEVGIRDRLTLAAHGAGSTRGASKPEDLLFSRTFEPLVMRRLPKTDVPRVIFAPEVAMFCFAHGVRLVTSEEAALRAIPVVTSFVLTTADKSRMYGACIVWYEELPAEVVAAYLDEADGTGAAPSAAVSMVADTAADIEATDSAEALHEEKIRRPTVHAPEAICLLSRVAVFDALMDSCRQLFRMRLSSRGPLPAEALEALLHTQIPPFGCRVEVPLGNVSVSVVTPAANQLPHTRAGRDFLQLFQALDANNVIMLWALLLTEQKVVLQCTQPHVLTMAAETLSALLFPFSWQHVYIPILPMRLIDILQAPVPFLVGIDKEILDLAESQRMIPDDVVQVDLDTNAIMCAASLAARLNLPQRQFHKLYKAIAPFCRPPSADVAGSDAARAFPMAPPPDMVLEESASRLTLAEMSEEAANKTITVIKGAFLRFMASIMAGYQELMIVPPSEIKLPAAIDFFDVKRWMARFNGPCSDWLSIFAASQSFTQFLEARLAPRDVPELDVVFFNETIDAKLARSAKHKLFAKYSTPLLTTGQMAVAGYMGQLVPTAARTVYNASLIAARPVQSQQQVGLLLVMGSGLQENEPEQVAAFAAALKQEFARNLLWSRVDVNAALLPHVVAWRSMGAEHHQRFKRFGVENLPVRQTMLDMMTYSDDAYREELRDSLRQSLRRLAHDGGSSMPLCVVGHGFGAVLAIDFFEELQREAADAASHAQELSPLERGETLAALCTMGCPRPLLVSAAPDRESLTTEATPEGRNLLQVPAATVLKRWPHLRGGWTNLHCRDDCLSYALQSTHPTVTSEVECRRRGKRDGAIHHEYLKLLEVQTAIAQSMSVVWQDTNRSSTT